MEQRRTSSGRGSKHRHRVRRTSKAKRSIYCLHCDERCNDDLCAEPAKCDACVTPVHHRCYGGYALHQSRRWIKVIEGLSQMESTHKPCITSNMETVEQTNDRRDRLENPQLGSCRNSPDDGGVRQMVHPSGKSDHSTTWIHQNQMSVPTEWGDPLSICSNLGGQPGSGTIPFCSSNDEQAAAWLDPDDVGPHCDYYNLLLNFL